jgi:hypothetical protein
MLVELAKSISTGSLQLVICGRKYYFGVNLYEGVGCLIYFTVQGKCGVRNIFYLSECIF